MTNVAERGFEGRFEDWADDAQYFEYSKAANPIGSGHTPKVPIVQFGPELYRDEPTGVVPLDLSTDLGIHTGAATSPALLANFVRIRPGEQVNTSANATSQLYYVLYGRGFSAVNDVMVQWEKGDFPTLPRAVARFSTCRRRCRLVLGARRAAVAVPGGRSDHAKVPRHQIPPRRRRRQAPRHRVSAGSQ
jgi:hypothetical protein